MTNIPAHVKNYDNLVERYCIFDDFCKSFLLSYQTHLISTGKIKRERDACLSIAELMTIAVEFHYSNFKNVKSFYFEYVLTFLKPLFPGICSYNRFIELIARTLIPLFYCLNKLLSRCSGISFVDSTPLRVCHIKRIFNHKTFNGIAGRGKSTMGWFFGFKLHLVVDDQGNLLSFTLTPANVDDRVPLDKLCKKLFGKLFADKGYISSKWFEKLLKKGLKLIYGIRSNMKNKLTPLIDLL